MEKGKKRKMFSLKWERIDCYFASMILWGFLFAGLLFGSQRHIAGKILSNAWDRGIFLPLLWAYLSIAVVVWYNFSKNVDWSTVKKVSIIFSIAFTLRISIAFFTNYLPTSDFTNYFSMGQMYLNGDYDQIAQISNRYGIASFSGLAVLNGCLMRMFSSSLFGLQIGNCALSATIAVMVLMITSLYSEKAGFLGGLLYTLYPSNIAFSTVPTNQHGATLFLLISVYFFLLIQKEEKKNFFLLSILSGCSMAVSYFFHPSVHSHIAAITIFLLLIIIKNIRDRNNIVTTLICGMGFALAIIITMAGTFSLLRNNGLLSQHEEQTTSLSKIVVGLNQETGGAYSAEDYGAFKGLESSEQTELAYQLIVQRLSSNTFGENIVFFAKKANRMWFSGDSSFNWLMSGMDAFEGNAKDDSTYSNIIDRKVVSAIGEVDIIYVLFIYMFAAIGIVVTGKNDVPVVSLSRWIILGWVGVHLLIEIQARYRYAVMPFLILFAAIGAMQSIEILKKCLSRGKSKNGYEPPEEVTQGYV